MLFEKCCSNTGKQHCCWLHPLKFNIIHLTIKFWKRRFFLANHHFQLNHAKLWGARKWGFFVPTTSGSWTAGTVSFCCIQREWNLDHRAAIDPCFRCHFFWIWWCCWSIQTETHDAGNIAGLQNIFKYLSNNMKLLNISKTKRCQKETIELQ